MDAKSPPKDPRIVEVLAKEFSDHAVSLPAVLEFFEAGVSIPFLATYRREKIGSLDEEALRDIRDRWTALRDLQAHRRAVLRKLEDAGLADEGMIRRVDRVRSHGALDDLELLTRADEEYRAAETKLGALATAIEKGESELPLEELAAPFISAEEGIADLEIAVGGVVKILGRRFSRNPDARQKIRNHFHASGKLVSKVKPGMDTQKKFENLKDFSQSVRSVPGYRVLAAFRGKRENALTVGVEADREKALQLLGRQFASSEEHPFREILQKSIERAYDTHLVTDREEELFATVKDRADVAAIKAFGKNLKQLLLQPPAGSAVVMGVKPGVRRGCRIAVVGADGNCVQHAAIHPFAPESMKDAEKKREAAGKTVGDFCRHHKVEYIAVGNGPGSLEVMKYFRRVASEDEGVTAKVVLRNEAGVAVYATSKGAERDLPKLDPRIRYAVSIARRLKDPLSELARMEPRQIGVGAYQREVDEKRLSAALNEIVVSCVSRIGVDLNTAGEHMLLRTAGLGPQSVRAILAHRKEHGPFKTRQQLLDVPGIDAVTFSACAGFLRVAGGENPLDRTAIHPESYSVVETMAGKLGIEPGDLVGNGSALEGLDPSGFIDERHGEATVHFIFDCLRKGDGDPRGIFEPPAFREDLKELKDLAPGTILEGVVTNVAAFGAFVDVGIDQEGLIHVSELSDDFVDDPAGVVTSGKSVKVRVIGVDLDRKRLSLSLRTPGARKPRREERGRKPGEGRPARGARGKPGGAPGRPGGQAGSRGAGRGGARGGGRGGADRGRGRKGDGRRGGREDHGDRQPRIIEQKAKRKPEPKIDPNLPEEEQFRLKLERLRRKFESGM